MLITMNLYVVEIFLFHRYPKIITDDTCPGIRNFLSKSGTEKGKLICLYSLKPTQILIIFKLPYTNSQRMADIN